MASRIAARLIVGWFFAGCDRYLDSRSPVGLHSKQGSGGGEAKSDA